MSQDPDSVDVSTVFDDQFESESVVSVERVDMSANNNSSNQPHREGPTGVHSPAGSSASAGLVRPKRRVVGNNNAKRLGVDIRRNYAVAKESQFTNFTELKNDMISPEYSQEIIEEVLSVSGIDTGNENATRMAEDIIFTFYIENAASQKTGHEKVVDVYGVEFDLMNVLRVLVSHGITPRRFTRGLAARIHAFLRLPENDALRADLVRRYALSDPDHAVLAFDGSTHIPNIPVEQIQVANMLATRGIYENTASVKNASERTTYDGVLAGNQTGAGALHYGAQKGV